jgi:hypothetical protein
MDATTIYNVALFLHIAGVLALFAGLTIEGIALRGLRHALTGDAARTWLGLLRPMRVIGPVALALILLPDLYLAATIDRGGGWIAGGLLGFLLIAILGAEITGRRMLVVGPALGRAQGSLTEEPLRLARDGGLATSYATRLAIALGVVWLMTLKPDFPLSLVVLVVAAVAGLVAGRFLPTGPADPGIVAGAVSGPGAQ